MARAFTRQLGEQPGVELAPLQDRTGNNVLGTWDQSVAVVGKFNRGRIDKPFVVNPSNFLSRLGQPSPITATSQLSEAQSHAYEALRNGARYVLAHRLVTSAATLSFATFESAATSTFAASATATGVTFSVKHLNCHNDGIRLSVHADVKKDSTGTPIANDVITVRVLDSADVLLHEIRGSLTEGAVDEFGNSVYLPDVSESITDLLEWTIPTGQTIDTTHDAYGRDASGNLKWTTSAVLTCFVEGGTAYTTTEYDLAVQRLRNAEIDYGYILGGGTRAIALITRLADLAFETNRQFLLDVPSDYSVAQAISFVESLGFSTVGRDHYPQIYYAPFKSLDILNGNIVAWGTSGAQAGFRCAKNAVTNAYGLSAKHQPIAGVRGNVGRTGYRQLAAHTNLTEQDLSDLADARIIPVVYSNYADGSFYAFTDAITAANTKLAWRKLVTVAEMSSYVDEVVARYSRQLLMIDTKTGIQRLTDFLDSFFSNCYASDWLVDSDDPNVKPYEFVIRRSPLRPASTLEVEYWLHYNGLVRQIKIQQVLV